MGSCFTHSEAPIEEMAVIKRDGKLFVDAFDGTGENIVTADQPISESGRARKGGLQSYSLMNH